MNGSAGSAIRGLLGAVVGGIFGYFAFLWLARQGLYGLMLPGALLGLGCATVLRKSSNVAGVLCALSAIPLGIFSEWRAFPFVVDESLGYFVTHLHDLRTMTMIMIVLGAVFAFWLGKGRDEYDVARPDALPET